MHELYDIADGKAEPGQGDPTVVFCMDEFCLDQVVVVPGIAAAAVIFVRGFTGVVDRLGGRQPLTAPLNGTPSGGVLPQPVELEEIDPH